LGVAALLIAALMLASVGVSLLLFTAWGRAHVAQTLERNINDEIMGTLHIGRIERIDWPWVEAEGVQIVAPSGVPAIDVEHVRIELDPTALREGRFAWRRAEIQGGTVRVSEDARHRVNMEETFRGRHKKPHERPKLSHSEERGTAPMDLRTMVTSNMTLLIYGGSLPKLRLSELDGVMSVTKLPNGRVTLRFDDYRGHMEGLPTGKLDFHHVKGHVETDQNRLLRFEGRGLSEGEPVSFALDIHTKPKHVKIEARFPRLSREAVATLGFSQYTRFSEHLELEVKPGELRAARH
jgi:hypothetical protein